jgi:hypothetical protein
VIRETASVSWYGPPLPDQSRSLGRFLSGVDRLAGENELIERVLYEHQFQPVLGLMWFTPDREMLVHAWEGQARFAWVSVQVAGLRILSRLADGSYVETANDFLATIKGFVKRPIRFGGSLMQLLYLHRDELMKADVPVVPFEDPSGRVVWNTFTAEELECSVAQGAARWIDEERTLCQRTFRGLLSEYGAFAVWVCRRFVGLSS